MKVEYSSRGFQYVMHERYTEPHVPMRLIAQSSVIGDYNDSFDRPGSSYVWIGDNHHLNREEAAELVKHLQSWLDTGYFVDGDEA